MMIKRMNYCDYKERNNELLKIFQKGLKEDASLEEKIAKTEALEEIISLNTGLIKSIAKGFCDYNIDLEDLLQESILGLIRAAERFDFSKNVSFSTYLVPYIKRSCQNLVCANSLLGIDEKTRKEYLDLCDAKYDYEQEYEKLPSYEELSEITGFSIRKIKVLEGLTNTHPSLDQTTDDFISLHEVIEGDENAFVIEDRIDVMFLRESVREAILMANLTDLEREVMARRFGFAPFCDSCTLDEISSIYGLSKTSVHRMLNIIYQKIMATNILTEDYTNSL